MASKNMIVIRLSAIQDLGSKDVLCIDKAGTLTEAVSHLERHVDPLGQPSDRPLMLAYFNSHYESGPDAQARPMSEADRLAIHAQYHALEQEGLRCAVSA
ncbi:hypothetical protein CYD26_10255 [Pseudomonas sp. FFUP_PS_473]|uniref:hypothetical protein n=1 Tax=Pseudomonas sp. FFUP_PS_473 TaxID=2060418 RepID=UPI000C7CFEB4|nr:hypothetical protein [Pseudomonas sp. FFUP_PS_473]PLP92452.1 hypothetical protein CYD26_10255 [Pseudomonas sp. FFUP_PS_473]